MWDVFQTIIGVLESPPFLTVYVVLLGALLFADKFQKVVTPSLTSFKFQNPVLFLGCDSCFTLFNLDFHILVFTFKF